MTKIGLLGCGRLGGIIADALCGGKVPGCRLVGVMGRGTGRAAQLAEKCGCVSCGNIRQLLALEPDYLVEAATAQALRDCALEVLSSGRRLICLSIGAFSDEDFYRQVSQTAQAHRAKVYLAPGVIGGFDIASTLSAMGELRGALIKYKFPSGSGRCPPALAGFPDRFEGSAREGFALSPAHLNIAIAAALACGSLDETQMRIEPVSQEDAPSFGLDLTGEFTGASLRVWQGGFGGKPEGPALAAWSVVALLRRLTAPVTFA